MDIIFVGCFYPPDREEEIRQNSKFGIDNASNNFQWALLAGLDHFYPNLKVITQPAIGTFPLKYKKLFFKKSDFSHVQGALDHCLGFINTPIIKHLAKTIDLYKTLEKEINPNIKTTIIIYAVHSPYLKAVIELKRNNDKIKICQIVPDLPQYMSESRNPIYRFLKSIDAILINKYIKKIDSFVLLSEYMTSALKVGKRPWIQVEGIYNYNEDLNLTTKKEKNKTILYTGNIGERYGIKNLLKAFSLIDNENYRLWIRGNGNTKEFIIAAAKSDLRIKYFEEIPKKELLELQKRATVLVNPVSSSQQFTKYFFPSKTMDYFASGTPTIMYRLKGVPEEYFRYCFVVKNETVEGLKEMIMDVCEKDQLELNELGRNASLFIHKNKNPIAQVKKIYEMINKI